MKKKAVAVLVALCGVGACLTGCGNENWGVGNYTFEHARINDGTKAYCVVVDSWHDNDLGCEIHTPYGGMYLSEGTYQLFEKAETCPYCKGGLATTIQCMYEGDY